MKLKFLSGLGDYVMFTSQALLSLRHLPRRRQEIVMQFKRIGYDSLFLITLTAAFTGMVTALQAVYQSRGYIPIHLLSVPRPIAR